jgi:hypothetical protein
LLIRKSKKDNPSQIKAPLSLKSLLHKPSGAVLASSATVHATPFFAHSESARRTINFRCGRNVVPFHVFVFSSKEKPTLWSAAHK